MKQQSVANAQQPHEEDDSLSQWLTFEIYQEVYGVPVRYVREVLRYTKVVPVPGSSKEVSGVINLRGTIVPIVDAHKRFALPSLSITDQTRIIITEYTDGPVGITVDKVESVRYIKNSEIELTPHVGGEEVERFIQGVHHDEDKRLIILLNLQEVLNQEDMIFKKK